MHEEPALNYINPVDEFKGHCSNIQTWFENGYNTQILHSNLSFPLLKALSRTDDPQASKIFKEEILIFLEYPYIRIDLEKGSNLNEENTLLQRILSEILLL